MKRSHVAGLLCTVLVFSATIVVDGEMIGAIGVGGGDENCAIEGLKAAFGNRVLLPVYPEQK